MKKQHDKCHRCACRPHCDSDCKNCGNCETCDCMECLKRFSPDG